MNQWEALKGLKGFSLINRMIIQFGITNFKDVWIRCTNMYYAVAAKSLENSSTDAPFYFSHTKLFKVRQKSTNSIFDTLRLAWHLDMWILDWW